ncbi:MAG: DUF5685 family protein [Aminipila sp.]
MLGYVIPEKGELKIREYDIYKSYYCGICKSVGRRYGQFPRLTLSYDFAFLAVLLDSLQKEMEEITQERCIRHQIKKSPVAKESEAIKFAGDVMLILAYYKLIDDYIDDKDYKAKTASMCLASAIRKLRAVKPELCELIETNLNGLSALEKEKCAELDRVEEPFANIMMEVFQAGVMDSSFSEKLNIDNTKKLMGHIGYHLGKWIYLIDAYEDIEENLQKKTYNPLIYRFQYEQNNEDLDTFRERIKPIVEFNLFHYLAEISNALDLLEIKKNRGIIDNIAYFGLRRKTENVLENIDKNKKSK